MDLVAKRLIVISKGIEGMKSPVDIYYVLVEKMHIIGLSASVE